MDRHGRSERVLRAVVAKAQLCPKGLSSVSPRRAMLGARAPAKASTQRGESPRQAERSPACNRRLPRRGDTGWGAAGGELPVRNTYF